MEKRQRKINKANSGKISDKIDKKLRNVWKSQKC